MPIDNWAAVGGHGYAAASVKGLPPELSVAGHVAITYWLPQGGPGIGERIEKVRPAGRAPVAVVALPFARDMPLHETGTF